MPIIVSELLTVTLHCTVLMHVYRVIRSYFLCVSEYVGNMIVITCKKYKSKQTLGKKVTSVLAKSALFAIMVL